MFAPTIFHVQPEYPTRSETGVRMHVEFHDARSFSFREYSFNTLLLELVTLPESRCDPQCRGTSVRKIIDIIIRFINTSIRASYFLISCKLKPNMKVFLSFDFKTSCGRCNGGRWNSDGKQSAAYFDNQLTVSCRTFKEHMMLNHPSRSKGDFLYLLMAIQGTAFENIIVPFTRYASKGSRLLRFS